MGADFMRPQFLDTAPCRFVPRQSDHSQTPFHFVRISLLGSSAGSMSLELCRLSSLANAAVVLWRKGKWFSACDLLTRTGQWWSVRVKRIWRLTGDLLLGFHVRTPKVPRHKRHGNTKIDIDDLKTSEKDRYWNFMYEPRRSLGIDGVAVLR